MLPPAAGESLAGVVRRIGLECGRFLRTTWVAGRTSPDSGRRTRHPEYLPTVGAELGKAAASSVRTGVTYGRLAVDGDVALAVYGERRSVPVGPSLQERQPGVPCHEVELVGVGVAKGERQYVVAPIPVQHDDLCY